MSEPILRQLTQAELDSLYRCELKHTFPAPVFRRFVQIPWSGVGDTEQKRGNFR